MQSTDQHVIRPEFNIRLMRWLSRFLPPISKVYEPWETVAPARLAPIHFAVGTLSIALTALGFIVLREISSAFSVTLHSLVVILVFRLTGSGIATSIFASTSTLLFVFWMFTYGPRVLSQDFHTCVTPAGQKPRRGRLAHMALFEEKYYRSGSEHWTLRQRLSSNLTFGMLHVFNPFYPLGVLLSLQVAGWMFMIVYLRQYAKTNSRASAVREAGAVHEAHNWMAILIIVAYIANPAI